MTIDFNHFINNYHLANTSSPYQNAILDLFDDFPQKHKFGFSYLEFPSLCIKKIDEEECLNQLYQLLRFYEHRFIELGIKEQYPKVYYQIYYCFFLIMKKCEGKNDLIEENKKNWIQKKWLTVCFNSQSDKNLKFWLESNIIDPNCPIDVEKNVRCILFDKERLKKDFEPNGSEMEFYASRAIDWFLKRYDWISAFSIIRKSIRSNMRFIQFVLFMGNICFVLSLTGDSIASIFFNNLNPEVSSFQVPPTRDVVVSCAINGMPFNVELVLAVLISAAIITALIGKLGFVRFFLPRLLGAVFIGFLPMVAGPEMYAFPLKISWIQVSIISGVLFLIAFLYLTVECYNIIGKEGVWERTCFVVLYGLLASFIMSLFLCDIAAVNFIDYSKGSYPVGYKGLFGIIYPKIVLFFAPAALLIGIFIQIFWEEKTITEPL